MREKLKKVDWGVIGVIALGMLFLAGGLWVMKADVGTFPELWDGGRLILGRTFVHVSANIGAKHAYFGFNSHGMYLGLIELRDLLLSGR